MGRLILSGEWRVAQTRELFTSYADGNKNRKVDPVPSWRLSTQIRLPCRSTIRLQVEQALMPVPRIALAFKRENSANIFSWCSGGMPIPLSATENITVSAECFS